MTYRGYSTYSKERETGFGAWRAFEDLFSFNIVDMRKAHAARRGPPAGAQGGGGGREQPSARTRKTASSMPAGFESNLPGTARMQVVSVNDLLEGFWAYLCADETHRVRKHISAISPTDRPGALVYEFKPQVAFPTHEQFWFERLEWKSTAQIMREYPDLATSSPTAFQMIHGGKNPSWTVIVLPIMAVPGNKKVAFEAFFGRYQEGSVYFNEKTAQLSAQFGKQALAEDKEAGSRKSLEALEATPFRICAYGSCPNMNMFCKETAVANEGIQAGNEVAAGLQSLGRKALKMCSRCRLVS